MSRPAIVLIACGAKKAPTARAAGELYQGGLFKLAKRAALELGEDYRIVSAAHGIVHPAEILEPYDAALRTAGGRVELEDLARRIREPLERLQRDGRVVALLPWSYAGALPASVENLMPRGLGIGRMLAHLRTIGGAA